ncbi:MAG: hydantoinase B/oxoprolinase family protein, partial [Gammaproteobacteria bacterium]|nr:hydantoinase B/oxoprolinase family protein [Gammaproteobacteria bacterium]
QHPARGRDGGQAGAAGGVSLDDGSEMQSKGKQWIPDDRHLVLNLPGGGGYGDPTKRERTLVERDLAREYIDPEQAAKDYNYVK